MKLFRRHRGAGPEGDNPKTRLIRVKQAGFSLLEVLITLTILAALMALVAPRLLGQVDRSKITTARIQAKELTQSLKLMHLDIGRYPTEQEGLSLLMQPSSNDAMWSGPYLDGDTMPLDPWGNPFKYTPPAGGIMDVPKVYSLGADNAPGGSGLNEDIFG